MYYVHTIYHACVYACNMNVVYKDVLLHKEDATGVHPRMIPVHGK